MSSLMAASAVGCGCQGISGLRPRRGVRFVLPAGLSGWGIQGGGQRSQASRRLSSASMRLLPVRAMSSASMSRSARGWKSGWGSQGCWPLSCRQGVNISWRICWVGSSVIYSSSVACRVLLDGFRLAPVTTGSRLAVPGDGRATHSEEHLPSSIQGAGVRSNRVCGG